LQQTRKSEPPKEPHNIRIKWVNPTAPGAGEGERPAATPEPELPNEPTDVASKEDTVAQAFDRVVRHAEPAATPSDAPDAKSSPGVVTTPARPHNGPIEPRPS
jgi:hypothetical protein